MCKNYKLIKKMSNFFNMFVKIILLISILLNIVNVNGFPLEKILFKNGNPLTQYLYHTRCMSTIRLDGKTVIVTGSNTGIGKETAKGFYERGAKVIMACRDHTKAEAAKESIIQMVKEEYTKKMAQTDSLPNTGINVGSLHIYPLDLSNLQSVRDCANAILENEKRIDILVNNAGVFMPDKKYSVDGNELHMAVNHLGHYLLTLLLVKKLKKSSPARIINVTSNAYAWGDRNMHFEDFELKNVNYSMFAAYGRSKLAIILFTRELAKHLKRNEVTVYAVFPGVAHHTQISRHLENGYRRFYMKKPYDVYTFLFKKTPKIAAQTILHCALDSGCASETGLYYSKFKATKPKKEARDDSTSKKLWIKSCLLVNFTVNDYPFNSYQDDCTPDALNYVDDSSSFTGDTGILDNSTFDEDLTVPFLHEDDES